MWTEDRGEEAGCGCAMRCPLSEQCQPPPPTPPTIPHRFLVATFEGIKLGKLGSPGTAHKFTTRISFHTQENKPQAALSCNTMPSFTPDSELELLFSPHVIPAEVKAQLGSDLHVRFCRISLCFD
jgi:hypothetical protein